MRRIFLTVLLITALLFSATVPSCDNKDDTSLAVFLGAVLILGVTMGGWFQNDWDDGPAYPPDKYDIMPIYGPNNISGSIISDRDFDWYRTDLMRKGDRIEIWSESDIGVRASLVDEDGRYYPTDNAPGTDFHLEIQAPKTTTYYLMVYGFEPYVQGEYKIWWKYKL